MDHRFLISVGALLILFAPYPARADSHVSVSFSVGGAVVIGAGVIYWGVSSGPRVGESTPSDENPNRLSLTNDGFARKLSPAIRFRPPYNGDKRPRADFVSLPNDSRAAPIVELPLFVLRW
jgi:hypothetical protein